MHAVAVPIAIRRVAPAVADGEGARNAVDRQRGHRAARCGTEVLCNAIPAASTAPYNPQHSVRSSHTSQYTGSAMFAAVVAAAAASSLCSSIPPTGSPTWPDQHWQHDQAALVELEADAPHHPCALGVVLNLHGSCDGMSEDHSSRLALALTNCHRAQSGRIPHPCNNSDSFITCTSPPVMTEADFGVYTSFRLKVDSICRFLALEATQHRADAATQLLVRGARKTAQAVEGLASDLDGISERMEFSSRVMVSAVEGARDKALLSIENLRGETEGVSSQLEIVLESSTLALEGQTSLMAQQTSLRKDMLDASAMLSAAMDDHARGMQRGWHEGLAVLHEEIKELVSGAFQHDLLNFHTVCYFFASSVAGWTLTNASRTRAARNVWFALMLLEWAVERGFVTSLLGYRHVLSPTGLWACRRAAAACGCISVVWAAWRYVDQAFVIQQKLGAHCTALEEHTSLLREVQRQQIALRDDLCRHLVSPASTPHHWQSTAEHHPQDRASGRALAQRLEAVSPHEHELAGGATVVGSALGGDQRAKSAASATHVGTMSYRELQSELKSRGLKAQGTKQALCLRLLHSSTLGDDIN